MKCFFLFLNALTLNPISPHILKQRLFLFHELCNSRGLYVYSSTWNSSQFYSLLVSKKREDAKEEIKSAFGSEGWIGVFCPHGHMWKIQESKIIGSTLPKWRVPSIFFPSIITFPFFFFFVESSLHEMKGSPSK